MVPKRVSELFYCKKIKICSVIIVVIKIGIRCALGYVLHCCDVQADGDSRFFTKALLTG